MPVSSASRRRRRSRPSATLRVESFAQIHEANIEFGDLTILVGPQGSGKSLLLQLFKLALDNAEIATALRDAGHVIDTKEELLDVYFGQGMRHAWRADTRVSVNGKALAMDRLARGKKRVSAARMFYIPAHRAMLLAEGWPAPFARLNADTPTVARLFSQNLFSLFGNPSDAELFPVPRRLKEEMREAIDAAVYHGGRVQLDKEALRKRLELHYGEARLPFMTWTAGQREFTPLLLGLYHLLPSRQIRKQPDIDWVVIEEPEMGLHPKAIAVVMLLVLDLLWRGYRVILSTHAPLVLDVVFMLRTLQENAGTPALLCKAFDIAHNGRTHPVMQEALEKTYRTFYMHFEDGMVAARDISGLDPSSEEGDEADWGGLTGFSSRFNAVIAEAVNG